MINRLEAIQNYISEKYPSGFSGVIAIDGRCGAGKTTLSNELKEKYDANIIRLDDYFLRPEQRTPERYAEIGGNFDRERLIDEVLYPLKNHLKVTYRPFSCKTMEVLDEVPFEKKDVTIVEGSYSFHPMLREYYDVKVFLDIDPTLQIERLRNRSPQKLDDFIQKWIPLEEKYFTSFDPKEVSDLYFFADLETK